MVYAMFSIGILGFIVWSRVNLVGSLNFGFKFKIIIITICKDTYHFILIYFCEFAGYLKSIILFLGASLIWFFLIENILSFYEIFENFKELWLNKIIYIENIKITSEILCLNSFSQSFLCKSKNLNGFKNLNSIDPEWIKWFIGFSEGDGSLITTTSGRLQFVLTQNEYSILNEISLTLGFGSVKFDNLANCYRFIVGDLENIFNLANIFNGNLFLDLKIKQLEAWIQVLKSKGYDINFKPDRISISLSDSWLSGFVDAGCFNVTVAKRSTMALGYRVLLRFIVDQNDQSALLSIQNLFGFGGVSFRSDTAACFRF